MSSLDRKTRQKMRAQRQRNAEARRLAEQCCTARILPVIAPPQAKQTPAPKAPPLLTQSRDAIDGLRESASRTGGHAAAGLLHLADLLTFHRTGFPNVREVRW